jgi:hypothetical protein
MVSSDSSHSAHLTTTAPSVSDLLLDQGIAPIGAPAGAWRVFGGYACSREIAGECWRGFPRRDPGAARPSASAGDPSSRKSSTQVAWIAK